ncbi:hypothetical protein B7P43_G18000 [Cryptotermes secundus]|uniref:Retrotransposon gag domain-containing protein n=1 Tax=Cryptotermes secundus TaxID=105785 RepID=A0A2J7QSQ0_9NEOP|nr:hypothetical protein B7P43_G18000 [Cryptotermes secundus]
MSKQWVEAVSRNLADYDSFKKEFLNSWWSAARQSLSKCNLYQAKYNRQSGLSLSGHFLKYATMASYLDPRPSDPEIIEAVRYHFPVGVQRAMLTNQLKTIGDTLDLLRRVEVLEAGEGFHRTPNQLQTQHPNTVRQGTNPVRGDNRVQTQTPVRQIQYSRSQNRRNGNWRRNGGNEGYRDRDYQGSGSRQLNPNVPPFQGRQEQVPPTGSGEHSGN